jgi:hypothetical protein
VKNRDIAACLKYSVLIFVEKIYKINIWRVAVRPSYIQDVRFLKVKRLKHRMKKVKFVKQRDYLYLHYHSGPGPPQYPGFTITLTPHSVGLLWKGDQPDPETFT